MGMLISEQTFLSGVIALFIGLLLAKKRNGFVLAIFLFTALGLTHKIVFYCFQPVLTVTECAEWKCAAISIYGPASSICSCSTIDFPLGTLVEWNGQSLPLLDRPFLARLTPFRSGASFNLAHWKQSRGISGQLEPIEQMSSSEQNLLNFLRASEQIAPLSVQLRQLIQSALIESFSGEVLCFLYAIATGNKTKLPFELKSIFAQTGLAHLLAVSGYHVGLVCFGPLMLLRTRRMSLRWVGLALVITMAWGFVSLCEWPASACRAATMITLYAIANAFYMQIDPIQVWSATLCLMLSKNPSLALDLGTQMSFSAVLSILLFARIASRFRSFKKTSMAMGIPIVAQLGTVATAIPAFHIFPFYFLPFNIAAQFAMTGIGLLFGAWGVCFALDLPVTLHHFFHQALSSLISQLLDWLYFFQHNFVLAINLDRTPRWIWIALSSLYFLHALRCIQFKKRTGYIFIQFVACVLILLPWGILAPMMRNPIVLKTHRKPVLHIPDGNALRMIAFDQRDSAAAHRRSIFNGTHNAKLTCLIPGEHWSNGRGEYLFWVSDREAIGCIAKRPCNYRYTGENKGTFCFEETSIYWESWGADQEFN